MKRVHNQQIYNSKLLKIISLSMVLMLSACSTSSEVFECEAGKGVGCKSISTVNKMVEQGKLSNNDEPDSSKAVAPVFAPNGLTHDALTAETMTAPTKTADNEEIVLSDQTTVNRVREEHLRVWVAPFQDDQGNLHEGSVIHTVIRSGYWQLTPMVQKKKKDKRSRQSKKNKERRIKE